MRIMYLGDLHGSGWWALKAIEVAVKYDVELIIQLGDWGLWPGRDGLLFRDKTNERLVRAGLIMMVTGGNHDDYDQVDRNYEVDKLDPLDLWPIESNIMWMPRGYRFKLGGTRFLSLGGAYSIDKQWRTPHKSWWVQEQLTDDDVKRAIDVEEPKVDVMVTHDIPWGAKPPWNRKAFIECMPNQEKVREVVNVCRPKWLFHGHLHFRYTDMMQIEGGHTVRVEGLDCDGSPEDASWIIRDTETMHSITTDLEETRADQSIYPGYPHST
jgi:predicted phosphodiesterase